MRDYYYDSWQPPFSMDRLSEFAPELGVMKYRSEDNLWDPRHRVHCKALEVEIKKDTGF